MEAVPISRLTSFQNQGVVSRVFQLDSVDELLTFRKRHPSFCVLGRGSNSVIDPSDQSVEYVQLTDAMLPLKYEDGVIEVSAGCSVSKLLSFCQAQGLMGLTFSAGVPASVGGMVAMNFGCWGQTVSDCLESAWVLLPNGKSVWLSADQMGFAYRMSYVLTEKWIVLGARFRCELADTDQVREDIYEKVQCRLSTQPLRGKTFGSIFKNPDGKFAGELIESVGLKGIQRGGAKLSDKHANFMENVDNATVSDVRCLIQYIQDFVWEKTGVKLVEEVQYLP